MSRLSTASNISFDGPGARTILDNDPTSFSSYTPYPDATLAPMATKSPTPAASIHTPISPANGEGSSAPAIKRVGGKANVSSACGPCKRAHLACDVARPCKRCVNMGKQDQCEDVPVGPLCFLPVSRRDLLIASAQEARKAKSSQASHGRALSAPGSRQRRLGSQRQRKVARSVRVRCSVHVHGGTTTSDDLPSHRPSPSCIPPQTRRLGPRGPPGTRQPVHRFHHHRSQDPSRKSSMLSTNRLPPTRVCQSQPSRLAASCRSTSH